MLVIIATHPIQYQVPLWKKITEAGIDLEVWYFTNFGINTSYDTEFGKAFSWDLPMLEGYKHSFLKVNENAAPNKGFRGIILKENLRKKLKKHKVTHVYINGWQVAAYWQALWAAKSLGLSIIFKGESNNIKPESKWKWPIKKFLLNHFFNKIDYFLYIGKANKKLYQKYGIPEEKLVPGLYCVDNERFRDNALRLRDQKNELRAKWGIPKDAFCILFSGKFITKKRPLDIINAVKKIINKYPNIHLLFVGDGELYDAIRAETNVLFDKEIGIIENVIIQELKPNITITGFLNQTEIPMAYTIADCLVLPSDFGETWGLVVNEAMASGIPCIVSDQCGSAEDLVEPISEKLIFKMGDIEGLSLAILSLIENKINPEHIENVIDKYTYSSTITSIKLILNKTAN